MLFQIVFQEKKIPYLIPVIIIMEPVEERFTDVSEDKIA